MRNKITKEEFIKSANIIHNNKYDYSLISYTNISEKIDIVCQKHGVFSQRPSSHLDGSGCRQCFHLSRQMDIKEFIEKANKVHSDKYDYSLVEYKNSRTKINIICPKHGLFTQKVNSHLNGKGCLKCGYIENSEKRRKSVEEFISESKNIHGNEYNYEHVNYINNSVKVKILCNKHGIFNQSPSKHVRGQGCPKCNQSKGERVISKLLDELFIDYDREHRFKKCYYKKALPFDFYLPKYNMCIEYNGRQHYEEIEFFGGSERLKYQRRLDDIKREFCEGSGINLIIISHKDKIKEKLLKCLKRDI